MKPRVERVRVALPIAVAIGSGLFLSIASHSLNWSDTSVFVVGAALAALLGLLGTPLLLLSWESSGELEQKQPLQLSPEKSVSLDLGEIGQIYLPLTHATEEADRLDMGSLPFAIYIPSEELNAEPGPNLKQLQSLLGKSSLRGHQSLIAELAEESDPIRARPLGRGRDRDPADVNSLDPKILKALLASQN
jgi:hypothetical protein